PEPAESTISEVTDLNAETGSSSATMFSVSYSVFTAASIVLCIDSRANGINIFPGVKGERTRHWPGNLISTLSRLYWEGTDGETWIETVATRERGFGYAVPVCAISSRPRHVSADSSSATRQSR